MKGHLSNDSKRLHNDIVDEAIMPILTSTQHNNAFWRLSTVQFNKLVMHFGISVFWARSTFYCPTPQPNGFTATDNINLTVGLERSKLILFDIIVCN